MQCAFARQIDQGAEWLVPKGSCLKGEEGKREEEALLRFVLVKERKRRIALTVVAMMIFSK